jgi:hypothetical protein
MMTLSLGSNEFKKIGADPAYPGNGDKLWIMYSNADNVLRVE